MAGKLKDKTTLEDDVNHQEVPTIVLPRNHKAKVSVWTELSVNDVDTLSFLASGDSIRIELARIFELKEWKSDTRQAIVLDLFYYAYQFARDNHFTKEQTSAFIAIVKQTHEVCIETPFGNLEQCFQYFKDMVLCHAVKRPPFSIDIFNADDVRKISEYVINTYFRHYKLYKYAFTPQVTLDLTFVYIGDSQSPEESTAEQLDTVLDAAAEEIETTVSHEESKSSTVEEKSPEVEAAMTELRRLVREHLCDELQKLRVSVEGQIKESENVINKKLDAAEATSQVAVTSAVKGPKDKKK